MARRSGKTLADLREESGVPYSVFTVANFFIGRSLREDDPIDHLELQWLVYYAYGFNLGLNKTKLFREQLRPTPRGPVVAELYHEFKKFGDRHLTKWSKDFDFTAGKFYIPLVSDDDLHTLLLLGHVWNHRDRFTPEKHATPCKIARGRGDEEISDDLIQDHFWNSAHA